MRVEDFERFVIRIFLKSTRLVFLHHKCDELKIFLTGQTTKLHPFSIAISHTNFRFCICQFLWEHFLFSPKIKSNSTITSFHWLRRHITIPIFVFNSSVVTTLSNQTSAFCGFILVEACYFMITCILITGIFSKSTRRVFLDQKWNRVKTDLTDWFLVWKWHCIHCECSIYW